MGQVEVDQRDGQPAAENHIARVVVAMADDPTIRIVILHPATASDAAKLERLAR